MPARCWGNNGDGQLGTPSWTSDPAPVTLTGTASVTAGWYHSCGTRSDGTARCWGYNGVGQLGDGNITSSSTPVLVAGGYTDWTSITADADHSCGTRSDGTARCWGYNGSGKLGDGTTTSSSTPVLVAGGYTDWAAVTAGGSHTLGLRS